MTPHAHHARSGYFTLTGIGILVTLLLVTGAGQYIWRQGTQMGAHCRDLMLSVSFNAGLDTCDAIGHTVVSWQRQLEQMVGQSAVGDVMNLEEYAGHIARQFSNATVGFRAPSLSGMINPQFLQQGGQGGGGFGSALTYGAHGSQLLQQGNTAQGLGFLQSSASMGPGGVLSQLQLGSAFSGGASGVPQDPARARAYYRQALQSIQALQASPDPQAARVLQALPGSPDTISRQLQGMVE